MESKKLIGLFFEDLRIQIGEYLELRDRFEKIRCQRFLANKRIALIEETKKKAAKRGLLVQDSEFMCKEG